MKFALRLLLSGALALAPWSCNRGNAPSESVSANSDQTQRSDGTERNQTTKATKPPNTNRDPEKQAPATESRRAPAAAPTPSAPTPAPRARTTETVHSGTALTVTLADAISTETNKEGDTFTDAGMIAGGAGVGAVIGAIAGGGKGAAIGAIIGGGTGTTAVLLTKGKQLKLEPETKINFVLSKDVDLPVIRNATT
jgi:hypothetical protein